MARITKEDAVKQVIDIIYQLRGSGVTLNEVVTAAKNHVFADLKAIRDEIEGETTNRT